MGRGSYNNGKFDLYVCFDKPNIDRQACKAKFDEASLLLYNATFGKLQFGNYYEVPNCKKDDPDVLIKPGNANFLSTESGLTITGGLITLYADRLLSNDGARLLLHEFGHYALCLYDESYGSQGAAHCADLTNYPHHCVMEYCYNANVVGFCDVQSHDTNTTLTTTNKQQEENNESCFATLSKNYSLGKPLPTGVTFADMPLSQTYPQYVESQVVPLALHLEVRPEYTEPRLIILPPESRYGLLLDRSQSMTPIALNGVKFGAHFWTTYLSQTCDKLALVFYNQDSQVLWPLASLSDIQLGPVLESISGITPTGQTNLEAVLREGLSQLTAPGYRAPIQDLILVADGVNNAGEPSEGWVTDLVANLAVEGIRLHAVGLGPHDDQVFLQRVTMGTGGRFYQLDVNPQEIEAQLAIQEAFVMQAAELRGSFGAVMMERGRLQEPTPAGLENLSTINLQGNYTPATLDFVHYNLLNLDYPDIVSRHPVYLEEGCQQATFITSYLKDAAVNVYLFRPSGEPVNPGVDMDVRFRQTADAPYAFYVVSEPVPGDWIVLVVRRQESEVVPFSVTVCSDHPDLAVAVDVGRQLFAVDQQITIKALASFHGEPLTDMEKPVAFVSSEIGGRGEGGEKIILEPEMTSFDERGNPLEKPVPRPIFRGTFSRPNPGSYSVTVNFSNLGNDRTPRFRRLKNLQVHVGPLSAGEDIEQLREGLV